MRVTNGVPSGDKQRSRGMEEALGTYHVWLHTGLNGDGAQAVCYERESSAPFDDRIRRGSES